MTNKPEPNTRAGEALFPEQTVNSFWSRVDRKGRDDCWPWLASVDRQGRGKFWVAGTGKHIPAPRFALAVASGKMPATSIFACHTCDNPSCCNPAHLWWGSRSANMKDCGMKGRHGLQVIYRGSANPQSKVTEDDVRQIRLGYSEGIKPKVLAERFGIGPGNIWKIATGRSWHHV